MSDSARKSILLTTVRPIVSSLDFRVFAALGFVGLIALGAQAKVPLPWTPVPITLQTVVVLAAGALLGPVEGAGAVAIYLTLGAFGVPLFTNPNAGLGLSYFAGVTGGYLIGFFIAAAFVGFVIRRSDKLLVQGLILAAGAMLILTLGSAWLAFVLGKSLPQGFAVGMVPFIAGDLVKAGIVLAVYRGCRAAGRRINAA